MYLMFLAILVISCGCSKNDTEITPPDDDNTWIYPTMQDLASCYGKWYEPAQCKHVDDEGNEYDTDEILKPTLIAGENPGILEFCIINDAELQYIDYMRKKCTVQYVYNQKTGMLVTKIQSMNIHEISADKILIRGKVNTDLLDQYVVDVSQFGEKSYWEQTYQLSKLYN